MQDTLASHRSSYRFGSHQSSSQFPCWPRSLRDRPAPESYISISVSVCCLEAPQSRSGPQAQYRPAPDMVECDELPPDQGDAKGAPEIGDVDTRDVTPRGHYGSPSQIASGAIRRLGGRCERRSATRRLQRASHKPRTTFPVWQFNGGWRKRFVIRPLVLIRRGIGARFIGPSPVWRELR